MPKGLRVSKNFTVMGWNNADRRFADDNALVAALKAYEAAGIRFVRLDRCGLDPFPRVGEIRNILEKRPVSYIHAARLGDLWMMSRVGLNKKSLAAMGGRLSVTSDKAGRRANKICPQFFSHNERFYRHLEESVIPQILTTSGVKDGDWVTMDMEPWQSGTYCYCTNCLTAFGKFAKLDHVPDMAEALTMKDVWAEFPARLRPMFTEELSNVHVVSYGHGEFGTVSAHAATIVALALLTSMVVRVKWLRVMMIAVAILVCYSRIYLACHFPQDILLGTLVGLVSGFIGAKLFGFIIRRWS
jgi:hypothetical protein